MYSQFMMHGQKNIKLTFTKFYVYNYETFTWFHTLEKGNNKAE